MFRNINLISQKHIFKINMDLNTLPPEQAYYLNLLTKFSGRTNRLKPLNPGDMSKRKEVFITENLIYLSVSDQVVFNDCKIQLNDAAAYSKGVFVGSFLLGMIVSIARTSATKSIGPGAIKSGLFGLAMTGGFYQYNYWEYQRKLHKVYVRVLNNRKMVGEKKEEESIKNDNEKENI